ncbi:MAG: hypothetical protein ACM3PS_16375, partial [Syntrophothermus sp.]
MKRLFSLLSVLVLASMLLAACGGAAATQPATQPPAEATQPPAEATQPPAGATQPPASTGSYDCTDPLGCVEIGPSDPVHIAYWGVLSGPDSSLGEDSKRGVEIAIDDKGGKILNHDILL